MNVKCRLHRCNHLPLMLQCWREKPFCLQATSACHPPCVSLGLIHRCRVLLTQQVYLVETPLTCHHHKKFVFLWLNTVFFNVSFKLCHTQKGFLQLVQSSELEVNVFVSASTSALITDLRPSQTI